MLLEAVAAALLTLLLTGTLPLQLQAADLRQQADEVLEIPKDFLLGVATSSFQIEGGWNHVGKGPSVWDDATHREPWRIADRSNADSACESIRLYRRDVEMVKELGVDTYRISLSWPRILPDGTLARSNQHGIDYYNRLINEMIANGIQPIVTLFHWDLPLTLQHLGGWTNPAIVDYFEDYARYVIALFGDRVKLWVTVNEPFQVCEFGYSDTIMAPFYNLTGVGGYLCTHWMLLAHARVYRMYKQEFKYQKGRMGISIHSYWFEGVDPQNPRDVEAAERGMQFNLGWTAHPIFVGDYPPAMRQRVDQASASEGLLRSRLPRFTPKEITMIKGSADFLGLNHYMSMLAEHNQSIPGPSLYRDAQLTLSSHPSWRGYFIKITPWGFGRLLRWVRDHYGNPPVIVTENGYSDPVQEMQDLDRVKYIKDYMREMILARRDGCDIRGYTIWSLMDNYEWTLGYSMRFGLYHVDFESEDKKRTPKLSALFVSNVTRSRSLPP